MGRFFCSIVVVAVAAAACNALTGAGDLGVGAPCPDCDAAAPDATVPDADPDVAADMTVDADAGGPLGCPPNFADCNGSADDGCEVDKRTNKDHCGACGTVCSVPGTACVDSKCGPPPPSCKALLASAPGTPSGMYLLDPDGTGPEAPFSAPCDMTTLGGGWTLVFVPALLPYNTPMLDYTSYTATLLKGATEALLAYRKGTTAMLMGATAVFALPAAWKTAAPFKASSQDLTVAVSLNGVPSSNMLRFGSASFANLCDDAWDETARYGRICIVGSKAPYYNGFAAAGPTDFCADSSQAYDAMICTVMHEFTIGVR